MFPFDVRINDFCKLHIDSFAFKNGFSQSVILFCFAAND